jgi:hypothetical protein
MSRFNSGRESFAPLTPSSTYVPTVRQPRASGELLQLTRLEGHVLAVVRRRHARVDRYSRCHRGFFLLRFPSVPASARPSPSARWRCPRLSSARAYGLHRHRDWRRGANQSESQPAIERPEPDANLRGGLLRAVGLFHLTPFSLRPQRAMSSTSKRMRQSRTLFRVSFASRARSGAFPFPPSACHTLSRYSAISPAIP